MCAFTCVYVIVFCEAACSRGCAAACPTVPGFYDFWGLAHRGEEFLHIWSETEECLTGVWQSKWAATEGDSVSGGNRLGHISAINWWCWRRFRARRDGVIPGSLHALPPVLYNCLGLLSQDTVLSLEIVPSVAPWNSGVALITLTASSSPNKYTHYSFFSSEYSDKDWRCNTVWKVIRKLFFFFFCWILPTIIRPDGRVQKSCSVYVTNSVVALN